MILAVCGGILLAVFILKMLQGFQRGLAFDRWRGKSVSAAIQVTPTVGGELVHFPSRGPHHLEIDIKVSVTYT